MHRQIKAFAAVGIAVVVALVALIGSVAAAPQRATVNVAAKDFEFAGKTVTISVGDTVTWANEGQAPHTATAANASFDSGNLAPGATFSQTFDTAGSFAYYCKFHGTADGTGMAGTIIVEAASAAQPTAAPTEAPAAAQPAATGSLDANDQPVGGTVTVASITAGQDGWVVVHLDNANAPGKVIGHTAVKQGDNANVQVTLEESVAAGGKVWPMLHIDAGTIGTYEFPGADVPVKNADGSVVMKQITLTGAQAAPAAPAAPTAPATLPNTGGDSDMPIAPIAGVAALLIGGALALQSRRRRA